MRNLMHNSSTMYDFYIENILVLFGLTYFTKSIFCSKKSVSSNLHRDQGRSSAKLKPRSSGLQSLQSLVWMLRMKYYGIL